MSDYKPFTAKDMSEYINDFDKTIDNFIDVYLKPKFLANGSTIEISDNLVSDHGFNNTHFTKQMEKRGFHVKYVCEDRPCGGCYYTITIPPQSE